MAIDVIMPKVDMDMTSGIIAKWYVKDGELVTKGQALFDIETDKSAMEIESPGSGVIKIGDAKEGTAHDIGKVLALIYADGEAVKNFATMPVAAVTAVKALVAQQSDSDLRAHEAPASEMGGLRATPLARRLARQAGIALATISGSGPRGRITAADITRAPVARPAMLSRSFDASAITSLYATGSYDTKPLDSMRRVIAQRLVESKQTVPHFYLSTTCTIDTLLATRARLNARAPRAEDKSPLWKLSINDFVIKAMALALQEVPDANVTFTDEGILQHHISDVGVAVSVEGGLFTPIIRNAEAKSLSKISIEMKELAAKARARKLQPSDYQGGTAAISNLGMYGVENFTAIINPPQASILAVGAAVERFVPVNKQPVLATQMSVTLSCDHRAIDGAVGAQLLAAFKGLIEDPALMLL